MSTIVLILYSLFSVAQTGATNRSFSIPVSSKSRSTGGGIVNHNYLGIATSIQGSPYLNEYFLPGTIELSNGEVLENVSIRYNVYKDVIEIDSEGEIREINKPNVVRSVTFNDRTFIYNPYLIKNAMKKNGYFEVLVEGPLTLYARRTNDLKMETRNSNFSKNGIGASYFDLQINYYVETSNKTVFSLSKKKLLDQISSHKSEMKTYIKKRKLDFKDELSVKRLIKYYNSL